MDNQLFRQKSLEKITSPEELHDYMRVTSPRLWMLLSAIVILLVGFIVYASTTTMENVMQIKVRVDSYTVNGGDDNTGEPENITLVSTVLPLSYKDSVNTGMDVRLLGFKGKVEYIGMMEEEGLYVSITMDQSFLSVPDGEYDAELVLESTTPISFLWN